MLTNDDIVILDHDDADTFHDASGTSTMTQPRTAPDHLAALEAWTEERKLHAIPDGGPQVVRLAIPRWWIKDLDTMLGHARLALHQGFNPHAALWRLCVLLGQSGMAGTPGYAPSKGWPGVPFDRLAELKTELDAVRPGHHPVEYPTLAKALVWAVEEQVRAAGGRPEAAVVPVLTQDRGWTDGAMIVDVDAGIAPASQKAFTLRQAKGRTMVLGAGITAAVLKSLTAMRRVVPPTRDAIPRFLAGRRYADEGGMVIVDQGGVKETYLAARVAILRGLKPTTWGLVPGTDLGLPKSPLVLVAYLNGRAAGLLMPTSPPTPRAQLESIWLDRGAQWTDAP